MKKSAAGYGLALALLLTLNFLLPRLMPGDPLQAIYGEEALLLMSEETKVRLIRQMALDKPWSEQFGRYLWNLLRLDLGYSYSFQAPVIDVLLRSLPWTLFLTGSALALSSLLGFLLGIESGWRRGKAAERRMLAAVLLLSGFPNFFVGMILLLVFAAGLGWFPLSGALTAYSFHTGFAWLADILWHGFLPVTALALAQLPEAYLLTRASMISAMSAPYLLTAESKGVGPRNLRFLHAGKNAMLPLVGKLGVSAGKAFTGALFIEVVFTYPGIGRLAHAGLMSRDYPLAQGVFLFLSVAVLVSNFLADMVIRKLDPRVKHAH